jgi:hypothetical protein
LRSCFFTTAFFLEAGLGEPLSEDGESELSLLLVSRLLGDVSVRFFVGRDDSLHEENELSLPLTSRFFPGISAPFRRGGEALADFRILESRLFGEDSRTLVLLGGEGEGESFFGEGDLASRFLGGDLVWRLLAAEGEGESLLL